MHYNSIARVRKSLANLVKLGHNFSAKAFIANQLRHWHAWLKIRRAYMDLMLSGIYERITINQLAKKAQAHRETVRACMRSKISISDIKQALKHWSRLRIKAWSKKNYGVEQAKLDSNYLYCEAVASPEQANKEAVLFWQKSKLCGSVERAAKKLALRASGLFRLSALKTPQVGNFSTIQADPVYNHIKLRGFSNGQGYNDFLVFQANSGIAVCPVHVCSDGTS